MNEGGGRKQGLQEEGMGCMDCVGNIVDAPFILTLIF